MQPTVGKMLSRLLMSYYRGPDHPMKLRLWGWFRRVTGAPRLTIPYADGGWIIVDDRCLVQWHVLRAGFAETEVWEALAASFDRDEIFWDIGAHIGVFTIRALLDHRIGQIHAFEPDPLNRERLGENVALNPGSDRCTIHPHALGSRAQRVKLFHGPATNTGLSSLRYPVGAETFKVECETADRLVFLKGLLPPTLMKVDTEGWESHVFQGAQRLLSERPPKAIVFEAECDDSGNVLDPTLIDMIRGFDYETRRIQRPSGEINRRENFLAVRRDLRLGR